MHGTALALAAAGRLAENLRHHLIQPPTLRDQMPMPAMRRRDSIRLPQRRAHAGRRRLLANRNMHEARNLASQRQIPSLRLKMPNLLHRVIHLEQLVLADIHEGPTSVWNPAKNRKRSDRRKTTIPNPSNPSNERGQPRFGSRVQAFAASAALAMW